LQLKSEQVQTLPPEPTPRAVPVVTSSPWESTLRNNSNKRIDLIHTFIQIIPQGGLPGGPIIRIFFENHIQENCRKFSYIRIDLNKNTLLINSSIPFSASKISQQSNAAEQLKI